MGRTLNHGLRSGDDGVIGERQAAVGASTRFDDFYAEQWPNPFRLAALMTHEAEAGADIAQDVFARMCRRGQVIERPGDSALATPTAA